MYRGCVPIVERNWLNQCFYTQVCQLGLQESCGRQLTFMTLPAQNVSLS
jgi:hypothetical protein